MTSRSKQAQNQEEEEWEDLEYCKEKQKKKVYKNYSDYLSTPNPRLVYTPPKVLLPQPVPRAALRAKANRRIQRLAHPKSLPSSFHSWESSPGVEPAALRFKITERLKELSVPSPRLVEVCLKEYGHILTDNRIEALEERQREGEELSRRLRDKYNIRGERDFDSGASGITLLSKVSKGARSAPETDIDHQRRLEMLAQPVQHQQLVVQRIGRRVPLYKLMKRIKHLSQPIARDTEAHKAKEWKFIPEMKNFKASDRLNQISKPRLRPNIHVNYDPKVPEAAKKCEASERTKILALPKRKAHDPDTELRENPFQVSPLALQAKCTPRLKELSQPVQRGPKK